MTGVQTCALPISTFDKVDGVKKVYDTVAVANGTPIPTLVSDGNDNGIQRYFSVTTDHFRKTELRDGQSYYFAVVSYAYNEFPDLPFHILRSSTVVRSGVPQMPPDGKRYGAAYADSLMATHTEGVSNGAVITRIIDPRLLSGNTYEVSFNEDTLTNVITWNLTDKTTNMPAIAPMIMALSADTNAHPAVIPTSPANAPLRDILISGLLNIFQAVNIAAIEPAPAARVVVIAM